MAVVLAGVLVTTVGGCGKSAGSAAGGGPSTAASSTASGTASTSATSSSAPSSTPSPSGSSTTTDATDHVVPAAVLEGALATKILAKSYTLDQSDSGDYPTTGGLNISSMGEYVSGDRGCLSLFNAHSPSPGAFAYASMWNKSSWFEEVAESYPTVSHARQVMAENVEQAKTCKSLKMRDTEGEVVTFRHTVTGARNKDLDVDLFMHHFNGETKSYTYEFHLFEGRVGGELMNILWASTNLRADPSSAAFTQFQKVINRYRKDHPRRGGASDGAAPAAAVAPGRALPRSDAGSHVNSLRARR